MCTCHSNVNDTTVQITAVSMTPLCMSQWCQWYCCACYIVFIRGVIDTAVPPTLSNLREWSEACTFLCGNLASLHTAQRCHWHRCGMQSGDDDTAVQMWHCCDYGPLIREAQATFTGNIYLRNIRNSGKLSYTISITFTHKIWWLIKERFWSQWCHWRRCYQNRRFPSRFSSQIWNH
jgi:hypothetical protein